MNVVFCVEHRNSSYHPGSTLWSDDLKADGFVSPAANASRISKALIWEGFMQSNFLCWSGGGGADFSPNGEVIDPHLDVRTSPKSVMFVSRVH